jgi:hypothetical protein
MRPYTYHPTGTSTAAPSSIIPYKRTGTRHGWVSPVWFNRAWNIHCTLLTTIPHTYACTYVGTHIPRMLHNVLSSCVLKKVQHSCCVWSKTRYSYLLLATKITSLSQSVSQSVSHPQKHDLMLWPPDLIHPSISFLCLAMLLSLLFHTFKLFLVELKLKRLFQFMCVDCAWAEPLFLVSTCTACSYLLYYSLQGWYWEGIRGIINHLLGPYGPGWLAIPSNNGKIGPSRSGSPAVVLGGDK